MKRWSIELNKTVVVHEVDDFLKDIEKVCKKHKMAISHETGLGGFQIDSFDKEKFKWLNMSHIGDLDMTQQNRRLSVENGSTDEKTV